ncbi:MAG: hypothetical protein IJ544_08025 [Prevotella sp.]|nr:hypothetical protein [Prevotella sp.]
MRVQRLLMVLFVMLCLSAAGLYWGLSVWPEENPEVLRPTEVRFALTSVMILVTLALIPLSLRFFKFKRVERSLYERGEEALKVFASVRMLTLFALLDINIALYFLCDEEPTFGWLAVILVLILPFVIPTKGRCLAEITPATAEPEEHAEPDETPESAESL